MILIFSIANVEHFLNYFKTAWKLLQMKNETIQWLGFSLQVFFTLGIGIWVKIGRGKVGLLGNIMVKTHVPTLKFDNVF